MFVSGGVSGAAGILGEQDAVLSGSGILHGGQEKMAEFEGSTAAVDLAMVGSSVFEDPDFYT